MSGQLTIKKSHSYFLSLTMISLLSNNRKKQFKIIRIEDQNLELDLISMFITTQIQTTTVVLSFVQVITIKNTSNMIRHLGRDLTVVQQVVFISRYCSGRYGPYNLHEHQQSSKYIIDNI